MIGERKYTCMLLYMCCVGGLPNLRRGRDSRYSLVIKTAARVENPILLCVEYASHSVHQQEAKIFIPVY